MALSMLIGVLHAFAGACLLYAELPPAIRLPGLGLVALSCIRALRLHGFRDAGNAMQALAIGDAPAVIYANGHRVLLDAVLPPVLTGPLMVARLRSANRTYALVYWQTDLNEALAWRLRRWLFKQHGQTLIGERRADGY